MRFIRLKNHWVFSFQFTGNQYYVLRKKIRINCVCVYLSSFSLLITVESLTFVSEHRWHTHVYIYHISFINSRYEILMHLQNSEVLPRGHAFFEQSFSMAIFTALERCFLERDTIEVRLFSCSSSEPCDHDLWKWSPRKCQMSGLSAKGTFCLVMSQASDSSAK